MLAIEDIIAKGRQQLQQGWGLRRQQPISERHGRQGSAHQLLAPFISWPPLPTTPPTVHPSLWIKTAYKRNTLPNTAKTTQCWCRITRVISRALCQARMQQNPIHEIKLSQKQAFVQVVVYSVLFTLCNTCHDLCYYLYSHCHRPRNMQRRQIEQSEQPIYALQINTRNWQTSFIIINQLSTEKMTNYRLPYTDLSV